MFTYSIQQEKAIAKKKALNRLFPEVRTELMIGGIKFHRNHNAVLELTWNNGNRDVEMILDNEALENGRWKVSMNGSEFNETAIILALDALNTIQ